MDMHFHLHDRNSFIVLLLTSGCVVRASSLLGLVEIRLLACQAHLCGSNSKSERRNRHDN
jgi:hypothetical protein